VVRGIGNRATAEEGGALPSVMVMQLSTLSIRSHRIRPLLSFQGSIGASAARAGP